LKEGTHELVGPKIQGNPYHLQNHCLLSHTRYHELNCLLTHKGYHVRTQGIPIDYAGLKHFLSESDFEGIVWHNTTGDMVKLKRTDFGLTWPT
ncbi:MAG: hypothetical protein JRI80_18985, partial [Deltaproteobacteria bacterium]|nr:hypothetical protein [Deltaproteobacteria bacterium]